MDADPITWTSILISWAPFVLLIGFWIFFMVVMVRGKQGKYMARSLVFLDRQEKLLERIAQALERLAERPDGK